MKSNTPPTIPESRIPNPDSGRARWWRTLEERADDPVFQERLRREFPSQIESISDPVERRAFLRLMGASLALAGVTACTRQPAETIVPYVRQPEELVPGRPLFFATAMAIGGVATGLLVESHEGRPTKIEGNPLHPGSLGAADLFAQAAVLGLYDPDRSQTLTNLGEIRPWSAFLGAIRAVLNAQQPLKGGGLRILTESISSPTLAAQLREFLSRYPSARWHQWDPASRENARAGAKLAFGQYVDPQYRIDRADVIVALDADFLGSGPGGLRYARDFAARRRPENASAMNRLYAIESMPTSTGARADHRLPLRPSDIAAAARQLAAELGVQPAGGTLSVATSNTERVRRFVDAVARDLQAHRGSSLVVAGDAQPPLVHALAHAMNAALGNVGTTVIYTETAEAEPTDQVQSLRNLVDDMSAGRVDALIILGGNPVYTAPADLSLDTAMSKVAFRVHLGLYEDETSAQCHWQVPEAHFLESWSDARGHDGTASIVQPLIAPLYGGRSAHELLAAMSDRPERTPYDLVREFWRVGKDDSAWRRWLHDGVVPNTAFAPKAVAVRSAALAGPAQPPPANGAGLEISFRNDPTVLDGRFANNGWLQELPKPITKLTWDNAVLVSPATARRLNLGGSPASTGGEHGQIVSDVVELKYRGRSVRGALFVVVGHPDECVTVHLGYGRTRAGHLGTGAGFNANAIRTADALWSGIGLDLVATGASSSLACTQYHHLMEGRGMVRAVTRDEFVRDPTSVRQGDETPPRIITLYPDVPYAGYKWGMAIDVNACIGCNACVVACQSENNIPVVGKEQVLRGRELHWLRVDTYYRGPQTNPETYFQPVPCMQCENAPCEVVCPVGATVHSDEGLNDMVYNRCVGTRYCSNNCPYKVRRFNFLLYADWNTPSLKLGRNPDVTVRSRGVMEKCTYCVQRINAAKIEAEKQDRRVGDGDIKTACQQTCPADAIVFGDLNDRNSRVATLQAEMRNYALLGELNTRPRTTYLAAVRNVNNELVIDVASDAQSHVPSAPPIIAPGHTFSTVTDKISSIVLTRKTSRGWWAGFFVSFALMNVMFASIAYLLVKGTGIWGINVPVAWGFAIVNFVWWIGIGHAGTLISAILLLLKQTWRTSINRFAEAMTLFAVACAGIFPIIHTGRPWLALYWLFPYPNTMGVWPQFRSPLIWDVFAVSTYATVSLLFWFVGLIPDLATLRDRSQSPVGRVVYGMLAMGWRGSAYHWHRYETAYLLLAGLATPLVVSVHTVVSFDFAIAIVPGWHTTIFPPYFVAGAIYSGFAMVLTLAIPIRAIYGLEDFITIRHLQNMAKVMLVTGLIVAYGYGTEMFIAWYSADKYEIFVPWNRITGPYGIAYWALILCNVAIPQLLWFRRARSNVIVLFVIAIIVNIGMWLERFVIVVTSLHRDFLPSSWGMYSPTFWDWGTYLGTIGMFLTLLFLFVRFLPMISIAEMRAILPEARVDEDLGSA